MFKKILLGLLMCSFIFLPVSETAAADDNAMIAVALYIDTSGHYVPGMDLLNKGLNEAIRYKVNLLFLGSEVLSGSQVLSDLSRFGVTSTASATPEALADYASSAHVNYTLLFTVRPLDVSLDIKAFSTAENSLLVDKTVTKPEGMSTLSTLSALSAMIGDEITNLYNMVHK
ncbi:MAG: hypothetical protein LLG02_15310 [Pelosinus sp.]|nr:hypothetical protein [Pelosinus sp.]